MPSSPKEVIGWPNILPPGAFYSAAGGDVSEDKGENFNYASLLVIETSPYGPTVTPSSTCDGT